jgi:hypothetical protein
LVCEHSTPFVGTLTARLENNFGKKSEEWAKGEFTAHDALTLLRLVFDTAALRSVGARLC